MTGEQAYDIATEQWAALGVNPDEIPDWMELCQEQQLVYEDIAAEAAEKDE